MKPSWAMGVAISVMAAQACTGQIGEGALEADDKAAPMQCTPTTLSEKPLRRLTNGELENALTHVVGSELAAGIELPTAATAADGFENDHHALQVNELVVDKLNALAFEVSKRVLQQPASVLRCDTEKDSDLACLELLIDDLGPRAFRRPMTTAQRTRYQSLAEELLQDEELAVAAALIVQALLQEPQFLYRLQHIDSDKSDDQADHFDGYTIAARIAFLLWQAPADDALLSDAKAGKLHDPVVREAHVRRMFADPRAEIPLRDFARQWLGLERLAAKAKDPDRFPQFDEALAAQMQEQSERFVAHTLTESGSLGGLLTSRQFPMTQELAGIYGISYDEASPWQLVSLPEDQRAGLLTQASFLTIGGHQLEGSPILRGVDVLSRFLCIEPTPPPPDIDTSVSGSEDDDQLRTNRERFEAHIAAPVCKSCHQSFNPIGYALENFDAIGQHRTHDNGLPVDAEATLNLAGDLAAEVNGPVALSHHFAKSPTVLNCLQQKLHRFSVARELSDGDRCLIQKGQASTPTAGMSYLDLLVRHVTGNDFVKRPTATAAKEKSES